jgi:A/G-specific adenine glycosylase
MSSTLQSSSEIVRFRRTVWGYYRAHGRRMPWRENTSEFSVVVSEVMLQQTQVSRVTEKFQEFTRLFPNFAALAEASDTEILRSWQGLGYNRRAFWLRTLAQVVCEKYDGQLPRTVEELDALPGIGPATARSIAAFAFNAPVCFIETNIRRVFIHHFFTDNESVPDSMILPFVEAALPKSRAREWYWALMDYGAYLARAVENPNRRSKHYHKQSRFEGSVRQLRGAIIRSLLSQPQTAEKLSAALKRPQPEIVSVLAKLIEEGFVSQRGKRYVIRG